MIHISERNSKLGRIPNISLPPLVSCVDNPPCAALCYARKAYEGYARSTTKPAWDENYEIWKLNPSSYFKEISDYLTRKKPAHFRWHVGGDIPNELYLFGMMAIARAHPETDFLAYSRRDYAWRTKTPDLPNLTILRSYWLGEQIEEQAGFQVVPKEQGLEEGSACSGSCAACKRCWNLKPGEIVQIHLH